ncbi:MAG: SRPBCC family protein [Gemmatimonadales bacterium]|nr:SRPBCC family protein [Gemmatimonadales bacterium]
MAAEVSNIHERLLPRPLSEVGGVLDSLSTETDRLWPNDHWPAMRFDRPLEVGASGGHGPIRYVVDGYEAGRRVRFRFTAPQGFIGHHGFELEPTESGDVILRHELRMTTHGPALITWPLLYRPLHDALIEDALTKAQAQLHLPALRRPWSRWVRFLRRVVVRRRPAH